MTQAVQPVGGEATSVDARTEATNVFEELASEFFPDEEDEQPAEGEAPQEGETEEAEDDLTDEAEADDLPPIEPPVSLSAEEKEAFKNLPREAQEFTARRIGELEKGFNAKAQEAARARQEAEQTAIQQVAALQQNMAQQYQQLASQVLPQSPDPVMLDSNSPYYNPQQFYTQKAAYESAVVQQQTLQQQADEYATQAQQYEQHLAQQQLAQEHALIVEQFPEYADPTKHEQLRAELSAVARDLGYPPELISQARASDIIAMKKAAEWKAKAAKLDRLESEKMEKVRAHKGLPKVAKPGVSVTADANRKATADQAFEAAKNARSRNEREAYFAEWLGNSGLV